MSPLVTNNLSAIQGLCKQHFVKKLHVFGSAARGEMQEDSDVDFLYEFDVSGIDFNNLATARYDYVDNFFSLQEELEKLFQRKVDLIPEKEIRNPYLLQSINEDKKLIYQA